MSAAKLVQTKAMLLGQEQGVAICIKPATFPLGPFATCTLHLSCYAARAGLFEDVLHVQVQDFGDFVWLFEGPHLCLHLQCFFGLVILPSFCHSRMMQLCASTGSAFNGF